MDRGRPAHNALEARTLGKLPKSGLSSALICRRDACDPLISSQLFAVTFKVALHLAEAIAAKFFAHGTREH